MSDPRFTPADLVEVSDSPELSDGDLALAQPFALQFPELAVALEAERRLRGRPKASTPKISTTLRLDPDVLAHFRATGPGWQSRINAALRRSADL
jgi:uncharacterized protein (DUF4415 family)